jgi:hypothetical protein
MTLAREEFDLVLVVGYFRSSLPLLSIVRQLSPQLRIGLCFQPLSPQMAAKTGKAQKIFERLCIEAGGIPQVAGSPAKCRLMLVQQYTYGGDFAASVRANIEAEKIWGMLTLASMGLEAHDAFIKQFGVTRLTVPDRRLADFLIKARKAHQSYEDLEMIEVGLPFQKYPVFEEFSVDWIIAAPTLFSFHSEAGKQKFLRDVLNLMAQMSPTDVVTYKPHNGNGRDYFTPRLHVVIASLISWLPNADGFLARIIRKLPSGVQIHVSRVLTALLHARVTRRAIPMKEFTSMADMSLEAFLPRVRKGVIGGESNSIWGALFFDLPYYNCISPDERSLGKSQLLPQKCDVLLELNLEYFGVSYCDGQILRGAKRQDIAFDPSRHNDLVHIISCACTLRDLSK